MKWAPRVTVAAVIENKGQFLVVEELQNNQIVINQPAGHLESNESLYDAIIREVYEETAWEFIPEFIIGIYRWINPEEHHTYLRICFSGIVNNHDPLQKLDTDILTIHWMSYEEILSKSLRSPMVKHCIDDFLAGHRYPLTLCKDLV